MEIHKNLAKEKAIELAFCGQGINCHNCNMGCKMGSGCFSADQIEDAAGFISMSVSEFKGKMLVSSTRFNTTLYKPKVIKDGMHFGRCVFYKEGMGCTIYPVRPLECMIAAHGELGENLHAWFTLNYFVNPDDPQSIREWSIYLQTIGTRIEGSSISELVPDEEHRKKIMSYEMLR